MKESNYCGCCLISRHVLRLKKDEATLTTSCCLRLLSIRSPKDIKAGSNRRSGRKYGQTSAIHAPFFLLFLEIITPSSFLFCREILDTRNKDGGREQNGIY